MKKEIKKQRSLSEIAKDIRKDWGVKDANGLWHSKMYFGAVPYFKAMETLNSINDSYGMDSAKSIVLYFLSNASSWKGDKAREIKAELKALCK